MPSKSSIKFWSKRVLLAAAIALVLAVGYDMFQAVAPVEAKEFSGTDLTGKPWTLSEHRGRGPIILNFFGTS
jgi:hypothetical protein